MPKDKMITNKDLTDAYIKAMFIELTPDKVNELNEIEYQYLAERRDLSDEELIELLCGNDIFELAKLKRILNEDLDPDLELLRANLREDAIETINEFREQDLARVCKKALEAPEDERISQSQKILQNFLYSRSDLSNVELIKSLADVYFNAIKSKLNTNGVEYFNESMVKAYLRLALREIVAKFRAGSTPRLTM